MDKIVATTKGAFGGALAVLWTTGAAFADQPRPWEWRFQDAATGIAEQIHWFERYTLWFIIPITLLVLFFAGLGRASLSRKRKPRAVQNQP